MTQINVLEDPFYTMKHLRTEALNSKYDMVDLSRGDPKDEPSPKSDEVWAHFIKEAAGLNGTEDRCDFTKKVGDFFEQELHCSGFPTNEAKDGIRGRGYGQDIHGDTVPRQIVAYYLNNYISRNFEKSERCIFDAKDITLFAGASEAVSVIFRTLTSVGYIKNESGASGISPVYGPYNVQFKHYNFNTVVLSTSLSNDYSLKVSGNEPWSHLDNWYKETEKINPRVFVLVSPNNPTGRIYTREELEKLAEYISKFKDCIVIEDLVYAEFAPEKSFTPFYHILPERTIVVSSLSKAYRSTGMRCGFVSTSEKFNNWFSRNAGQNFRDRMGLIKSPDNIGAFSHTHHLSRPVQYAGTFKLIESLVDDQNMSSFVAELKRRWTAFQEIVSLPVKESFVPYYILTDIEQWIKKSSRNDISTPEDFFLKLAREKGVVLLPAASFFVNKEIEHKWFARVSTANVNYEQTTEAANRIKDFLGI